MTTDQIRFFLSLATRLNFRAVAERFFITQPTLSRQIASLEEELQVKLFERSTKGVSLTPAGEVFYKGISDIYRELQDVITQTQNTAARQDVRLVVAVQDDQLMSRPLADALGEFARQYPDIRIVLRRVPVNNLYDGLLTGDYHVINMLDIDGQYLRSTEYVVLSEAPTCLAMQRGLAADYPDGITTAQLEELTHRVPLNLLSPDHFANGSEPIQALIQNIGLHPENTCYEANADPSSVSLRVTSGLCVSVANPDNILAQDPAVGLCPILGSAPLRKLMLYNPTLMNDQTRAFLEIFQAKWAQ